VRKEKGAPVSTLGVTEEVVEGRSFKDVVGDRLCVRRIGKEKEAADDGGKGCSEVVWEVEVDLVALSKLKDSFVGFLAEQKDHLVVQRNFVMDGYHNKMVILLGHKQVLSSSSVEGEVQELIGAVGWWYTWFERFEEWSPNWSSSNLRVTWLTCFGVPLHMWGDAIFRMLVFKFGSFIETDYTTKNMLRGDLARIKITTNDILY
jgi:hypothetical protein